MWLCSSWGEKKKGRGRFGKGEREFIGAAAGSAAPRRRRCARRDDDGLRQAGGEDGAVVRGRRWEGGEGGKRSLSG